MLLESITPTQKLEYHAAASYKRARVAGMPAGITSAHRSTEAQEALYRAYLSGHGNFALPPWRHPPDTSRCDATWQSELE